MPGLIPKDLTNIFVTVAGLCRIVLVRFAPRVVQSLRHLKSATARRQRLGMGCAVIPGESELTIQWKTLSVAGETELKAGIECTICKKMVIDLIFLPETNEEVFRWLREHFAEDPHLELQFCGICQQSVNEKYRQEDGGQHNDDS